MSQFRFEGRNREGKRKRGRITGDSQREAVLALREKGIAVIDLTEVKETIFTKDISFQRRIKSEDLVVFLRQFATLIEAGVSVVDATQILAVQTSNKRLKTALVSIEDDLRSGKPFSEGAFKFADVFPPLFVNMMQAGEAGGNLDESLNHLAGYYEKQHDTKQKVLAAMAYPITVAAVAFIVVIFLMTAVVPTFTEMFAQFDAQLPLITQIVLGISQWLQSFWWLLVLIALTLMIIIYSLKNKASGKYYIDYSLLKMPVFGPLLQKAAIARMARTMSSLFTSSIPILQTVSIAEKVVGNEVLADVLKKSREALESGNPLNGPMKESWVFPELVTHMIAIGEKTGSLDTMLEKVADFYESEVDHATDKLKSLVEPVMIVVLALVVGVIVVSIVVPMFELYNQF